MKIEIKLLKAKKETAEGFPLVVEISHQGKRKQKRIAFCKANHFSADHKNVTSKHPDYDFLAPAIMDIKIRAKKLILSNVASVEKVYAELFKPNADTVRLSDFFKELLLEIEAMIIRLIKNNDVIAANKMAGNTTVYKTAMQQFELVCGNVMVGDLDYNLLMKFRNYQIGLGNSKSTVHLYLRTVRAIYNKAVLKYGLMDSKPFAGVFDGLKVKSYDNKKKHITKEAIKLLEAFEFGNEKQKYVDLFLLQFYFGGADLIDVYYLKKMGYRRNRVYFERGKVNTGLLIDLGVHEKAKRIIDKYKCEDAIWLFPWRKDKKGYEGFRRRYLRALNEAVSGINENQENAIEVLPLGGNIGVKVVRHTFATIAKNLYIDPDLIRELMGHERDDVDNYYKDKFPEKVRDEALFRIID